MAAITPNTNLYLLQNINNLSKQNQLTFANATSQHNYFMSLANKLYVDNFTYQRKDYIIRYPGCIDDIINYNYCMYQNEEYTDKWFYAYIKNMRYVNDNVTEITIETDVYQTFMFDVEFKTSFVEREHVADDTVGLHTIPEGLETGEYIINGITSLYSGGNSTYICVASTETPITIGQNPYTRQYGGIYSGVFYTAFNDSYNASKFIFALDRMGKGDAITAVFLVPTSLTGTITFTHYAPETPPGSGVYTEFDAAPIPTSTTYVTLATSSDITSPTTLNGYTPKNKKLYCHPYNYFYITNNVGSDAEFHYEDFISNTAKFKTVGTITPGCSIKCFPLNYKKFADSTGSVNTMNSYNYGISAPKYPICSWSNDVYINWLTQNGVNIGGITLNAAQAGYLFSGVQLGAGIGLAAGGDPVAGGAMIANGARGIFETMQSNYQHSLIPDTAKGNANSGDITFSAGNMDIPLYKMSVRAEMAAIIDGYFNMFGYKVNALKVPSLNSRVYWNYVKCIGVNIEGLIPEFYMDELKAMFNNGITLWHDPTKFLDYSQTNSIVS